jgi:hypothetical protein
VGVRVDGPDATAADGHLPTRRTWLQRAEATLEREHTGAKGQLSDKCPAIGHAMHRVSRPGVTGFSLQQHFPR